MDSDKNSISSERFVESIAYLLRETFEGSPEGQPSAYLDRGTGFLSTLDELSAEAASRDIAGSTIAAQTEHAKFYLDRLCEFIGGRTERVNWEDSWLIEAVNDGEWDALKAAVKTSYTNTMKCLAQVTDWSDMQIGMAVGIVAHTAYHLGSIRQIAKSAKQ